MLQTEKPKILLVDDNQLNLELLSQELEDLNYDIVTAASGNDALKLTKHNLPDLVLLDWMMPGMSELELLEKWRGEERTRTLPVIMVTAKTASEDIVQGLKAGANDYVTKPVDFEILQARMLTHLRLHHMREELRYKNEQMERELEAARRMQLASLPDLEDVNRVGGNHNITFASFYEASNQLAGDYWDILDQHDQITFLIVDFAGHGVVPSINTFRFKTFLHSQCMDVRDPGRILMMANDYFCRQLTEYDYATVAACSYIKSERKLLYANAGHLPPILIRKGSDKPVEFPKGAFPIGLIAKCEYASTEIMIEPGDKLFIYTDGLIEIWNPEGTMFGVSNLFKFLNDHLDVDVDVLVRSVIERVKQHNGNEPLTDDITALAVKFD